MDFAAYSPTTYADVLGRDAVMDSGIRPLWTGMPRVAGPAYTVRCAPGDNLMLHAAIYRAPAGAVIVVQAGDLDYAVAGGNVCAIAQQRGIAALVIDGVVRDIAESRERRFPIFARGVIPIPGVKAALGDLGRPVTCGGIRVGPGDVIVADEEGVVAIPAARGTDVFARARERAAKDAAQTLEQWRAEHEPRIEAVLSELGFNE